MTSLPRFHNAIAMIELIFSIVIMGIVLLAAPLMLITANQSSSVAFQQESIAMLATHSNALMSYAWDEQNTPSQGEYGILSTTSSTQILKRQSPLSPGMVRRKKYFLGLPIEINASASYTFGEKIDIDPHTVSVEPIKDDIDDFEGTSIQLTLANNPLASATQSDYMDKNILITTHVNYYTDASSAIDTNRSYSNPTALNTNATSHVKFIRTILRSHDKEIKMHLFMCNIGTVALDKAIK